jgi:ElaB/YqjD/DUF883 family membrane-anchored ribosome-binding protein
MNDTTAIQRDKLVADLKNVIADAEEMLKLSAGQAGEEALRLRKARDRFVVRNAVG